MYSIRLIKKEITQVDKNNKEILDEFASATHLKICNKNLYLFDPVTNNYDDENENEPYNLSEFSHIFINHYFIFTIDELIEAYKQITSAYSMLNQTSAYHRDFDNIVSVFEITETIYAIKEKKILDAVLGKEKVKTKIKKQKKEDKKTQNQDETINEDIKNDDNNDDNNIKDDDYE